MKFKGIKAITSIAKVVVSAIAVIGGMMCVNTQEAQAEDIIHTHIWATKYDDSKHWEYCTVCSKTKDVEEHKCVDNWFGQPNTCFVYSYSTRICECGYSYIYHKPHGNPISGNPLHVRLEHYDKCSDCGVQLNTIRCKDAEGYLSCKNIGTCSVCGQTSNPNNHYILKNGKCRDCGMAIWEFSDYTLKYSSDYKTATVVFSVKPLSSAVELTGNMSGYVKGGVSENTKNFSKVEWSHVKNSDRSVTYTGVFTFDSSTQKKCTFKVCNASDAVKVNGQYCVADSNQLDITFWQDHTKPTVTEIKQVDQTLFNTWATIKELTIMGTEDLSNVVTISIIDPQTGDIIVDKAKTDVKDGKYSYQCTPPLEGPVEGRKYTLIVVDEVGNKLEKDFMIYKTDCRAPILRSAKEFTQWSRTKNIIFKLTDYGSGSAQTSILDQVSYKKTELVDGYYNAKYTFAEDNYGVTEYKLYVRDGLGNAGLEIIKIGKIDNTKPTVTEIVNELIKDDALNPIGVMFKITANDINTKLNAEGSGVSGYAMTNSEEKPADDAWSESNEIKITEAGKYYLWVKDLAGNIADVQIIIVNDDFSVEIDSDAVIEVEDTEEETYNEVILEDKEDKKEESKEEKKDVTPDTGDSSFVVIAIVAMLISGAIVLFIKKKKSAMYN